MEAFTKSLNIFLFREPITQAAAGTKKQEIYNLQLTIDNQ